MKKVYQISILGGTDGFGKWLCEYILKEFSQYVNITITGRNRDKGEKLARELGVIFSDNNIESVKGADIIIYSVPISYTQKVIQETITFIKPGSVVCDVTSIKKFPSSAMQVRDDIIVIPMHPMFGPYIQSIAGQVCVLTPKESVKNLQEYIFLKQYLQEKKARVIESTPQYHDKMMAVVQGLTHLNMFVVGETMKRLGFNIADSMDFISPIYKLMVSSVGRYLGQNPGLYADIQMYNDEILQVHEAFLDTVNNFHSSVKNKDYDKFCSDIISAREFLGVKNCQEGQEYTDKIIHLMSRQLEKLKSAKGSEINIINIYSGEKVLGVLLDFSEKEISLLSGKKYKLATWEVL